MRLKLLSLGAAVVVLGLAVAQQTPKTVVSTYEALADSILALKRTEAAFVRTVLATHYQHAQQAAQRGEWEHAAAEIALFANEGDNAIGGVRKRLLEGGHHHNAEGEAKGVFDPGFVLVTRKAKEDALAASAAMRQAGDEAARKAAWERFAAVARPLVPVE